MAKNGWDPIIQLNGVSFQYDPASKVLDHINLTMERGDFLGLVGPNGSGKSTLLKIILGLLHPDQGEVKLFGEKIEHFKDWTRLGYVSQKANSLIPVFQLASLKWYRQVYLAKWVYLNGWGEMKKRESMKPSSWSGLAI